MQKRELLIALWHNLEGSKRIIMDNILKAQEHLLSTDPITGRLVHPDGPATIYSQIKNMLWEFMETPVARQLRVKKEWKDFHKGQSTALQFGAEWVKMLAELKEVGLPTDPVDLALEYITKVGKQEGDRIQLDKREYPVAGEPGKFQFRAARTWEEFQAILIESDSVRSSTKAFQQHRAAVQQRAGPNDDTTPDKGRGKGKKEKENVLPDNSKTLSLIHI